MMDCGIYSLNFPDGQFYIGSSCTMRKRTRSHGWYLERGDHPNDRLQKAFNEFKTVENKVLLVCQKDKLKFYEQIVIDGLNPKLNLSRIADRPEMTPEVCAKISAAATGRPCSAETRAKMSKARVGRRHTEDAKALMSSLAVGRRNSDEAKAKMAKAKLGKLLSESHRKKLSDAQNKRWLNPAERDKLSTAQQARRLREKLAKQEIKHGIRSQGVAPQERPVMA